MRATDPAVGKRSARLHRDLPEQHFAKAVEDLFDVIRLAYRDAAAGDHHVGRLCSFVKGTLHRLRVIADHAHVEYIAAQPGEHAVEGVAVAVVDLPDAERT